jgi:HTH-type transcriptional regulator/antitoxin HipB
MSSEYNAQTPDQLAQILRGYRKERKLSQAAVADRTGMLAKTVSALENHPEKAMVDSLFQLLSGLDVELVLRDRRSRRSPAKW